MEITNILNWIVGKLFKLSILFAILSAILLLINWKTNISSIYIIDLVCICMGFICTIIAMVISWLNNLMKNDDDL